MLKIEPIITEKTTNLVKKSGIYVFRAPIRATKADIKDFFKKVYSYKVLKSRMVRIPSKTKRNRLNGKKYEKKGYKKFYIEFEGEVKFAKFK